MPFSVNRATVLGNLGRDPDVRYSPDGKAIANFSVATSSGKKLPDGKWENVTEWHRIVCFDKQAELVSEQATKGSKVYVDGRMQSRKYTDKNGNERDSFEIIANVVIVLDSRGGNSEGGETPSAPRPRRAPVANDNPFSGLEEGESKDWFFPEEDSK